VTREAAGNVQPESLAAESYRADGEFARNRNAEPNDSGAGAVPRSHAGAGAGEAPSYLGSQYASHGNGPPHGKNLKEGGFDDKDVQDGVRKAFNAEPGSIDDPGRLAESQFAKREAAVPLATPRDSNLKTGTAYDGLEREVNA
jgi:hypothetical protein